MNGSLATSPKTKVCALIACTGDSLHSCGQLLNSTDVRFKEPVHFEKIEIEVPSNVTKNSVFVPNGLFSDFKVLNTTDYTFESSGNKESRSFKMSLQKPTWFKRGDLLTFAVASYGFESDN